MGRIGDIVSQMDALKKESLSHKSICPDKISGVFVNPVEDLVREAEYWKDFRGGRVFSVSLDAHEVVRSEYDHLQNEIAAISGGPSSAVDLESKVEAWLSQE